MSGRELAHPHQYFHPDLFVYLNKNHWAYRTNPVYSLFEFLFVYVSVSLPTKTSPDSDPPRRLFRFLCERGSLAYRKYRKRVLALRYNDQSGGQANEDDVEGDDFDEEDDDEAGGHFENDLMRHNVNDATHQPVAEAGLGAKGQDQSEAGPGADMDKYDPADMFEEEDDHDVAFDEPGQGNDDTGNKSSERSYDSDTEYMCEAKKRNFGRMKRKKDIDERIPFRDSSTSDSDDDAADPKSGGHEAAAARKKRSRWGEHVVAHQAKMQPNPFAAFGIASTSGAGKPMLSQVTRSDPALLAYAHQSYGTVNLDEDTWRKCEDHFKVNLLYQDMLRKRNEMDRLARAGRQKYEYDSDEDVQGGTWEHKLRNAEMEATAVWSDALTKQAEGKHHIGDFLPPEELKKFMEKYESQQNNREPDLSDYREYKLREDNKGK